MIRTIEDIDRAHIDLHRNVLAPRESKSQAEMANAFHAEEMERAAKWPELLMLFLAGMCAGGIIVTAIIKV